MKNILVAFLLFLIVSCQEEDEPSTLVGNWQINWITPSESRVGQLTLNNDHTGIISFSENRSSRLLPNSEYVYVKWKENTNQLILTRVDNNFKLKYRIDKRSPHSIQMHYLDNIIVSLTH